MREMSARRRIVVGVDGSLPSLYALRWAGREARLRGAQLCTVVVDPTSTYSCAPYAPRIPESPRQRWTRLGARLVDAISTALGPCPAVAVHEHVEEGVPGQVLARYARGAELLVLGSHRRPGPAALGPTVRDCLRAASCPVVVVRCDQAEAVDGRLVPSGGAAAATPTDRASVGTTALAR